MTKTITAVLLTGAFSLAAPQMANASINQSLESVCNASVKISNDNAGSHVTTQQSYDAKLTQAFNASNCHGKELITTLRLSTQIDNADSENSSDNLALSGN